jgi:hypothetical protein
MNDVERGGSGSSVAATIRTTIVAPIAQVCTRNDRTNVRVRIALLRHLRAFVSRGSPAGRYVTFDTAHAVQFRRSFFFASFDPFVPFVSQK